MKIGVYVGSFNPVHKGHIAIAKHLINNNYIDKIIIVPTENYWDKNNLININSRIEMLKYYEDDLIKIDTNLNHLQYTYQILESLTNENDDLYLVIGADNLYNFHLWKNIDDIIKYKIIVIPRNNIDMDKEILRFNTDNFILVNDYKGQDISSTNIRKLINDNEINDLNAYLDKKIIEYITINNLYRGVK